MTALLIANNSGAKKYLLTLGRATKTAQNLRQLIGGLQNAPTEQLVVIAADVTLDVAIEAAIELQSLRPTLGIILVRDRLDASTYARAMNAGIRFLVADGDAAQLLAAVEKSRTISAKLTGFDSEKSAIGKGEILLVFAAKGGCGKTTVSTNLAVALAADTSVRVCLVDLDLQFGDVAIALDLEPTRTIIDAVGLGENLNRETLDSVLVGYSENLKVLLAPTDPAHIDSVTPELVHKLLQLLKTQFDYIVVDTPPAISDVILQSIDAADQFVLLTTLDAPSIKNLRLAMSALEGLGVPSEKLHLVANMCSPERGVSIRDLERSLGVVASLAIPQSRLVMQSLNIGKAAVAMNPLDAASAAFQLLARKLQVDYSASQSEPQGPFLRPLLNAKWVVNR